MDDLEGTVAAGRHKSRGQSVNMGQRRRFSAQSPDEHIQNRAFPVHFYIHTGGGIAHPAFETQARRQVIDKRPEANTLNDAVNMDVSAL